MKKFTLLSLMVLFTIGVFAQSLITSKNNNYKAPGKNLQSVNQAKAVIWSSDFSVPADWTISNAAPPDNWVIGTTGPSGTYAIASITSTTAANGFALFDSDLMCSGNQDGYLTTTNSIDCSTQATVILQFESFYGKYNDSIYVMVSNDNVAWTDFQIHASYAVNEMDPTNPTNEMVDISAVAGNQATVWIRFNFRSVNSGCDYAWMVDDVELVDIAVPEVSVAASADYYLIPSILNPSFNLTANLMNSGADYASDIVVDGSGILGTTYTGTGTQTGGLINGQIAEVAITPAYTNNTIGTYTFEFNAPVTDDSNPGNNVDTLTIAVSDSTLARDGGVTIGSLGFGTGTEGYQGQMFSVTTTGTELSSVMFALTNATAGNQTRVDVYSMNAGSPDAVIATTGNFPIDTTGVYTVPLTSPLALTPGDFALIVYEEAAINNISLAYTNDYIAGVTFISFDGTTWEDPANYGFKITYILRANIRPIITAGIDANLTVLTFPATAMANTDVDITGTVQNTGTDTITSFDVAYTVDGGTSIGPYSVVCDMATNATYDFTHDVPFNNAVEAIYNIEVTISNVNGGGETNLTNNVLSKNLDIITQIQSFIDEDIQMYPNPTTGVINLMNVENTTIEIYNILGENVLTINNSNSIEKIDMSSYNNGTYIIKVKTENSVATSKIVLNK